MVDTGSNRAAWTEFWASRDARQNGCLPSGDDRLAGAIQTVWNGWAASLPKYAQVLDVGSGNGTVMAAILRTRRDLKPVGIDYATAVPTAPRGSKLRGGIAMEKLPFRSGQFIAATSQFAFEYGDMPAVAGELRRVLAPTGRLALVLHCQDSAIVRHNWNRLRALRWLLDEFRLLDKLQSSLALGAPIATADRTVAHAVRLAAAQFGPASAAVEPCLALQAFLVDPALGTAQIQAVVQRIGAQAKAECARIAAMAAAAERVGDGAPVAALLGAHGFDQIAYRRLSIGKDDEPFALLLVAVRTD